MNKSWKIARNEKVCFLIWLPSGFPFNVKRLRVFSPRSNNTNNDNNEKHVDMTEEEDEMGGSKKRIMYTLINEKLEQRWWLFESQGL